MTAMVSRKAIATLVAFVCCWSLAAGAEGFINFAKAPNDVIVKDTETANTNPPKQWYASWPTNYRLILLGNKLFRFTMNCFVDSLPAKYHLTELKFCFNPKSGKENCKTVSPSDTKLTMNVRDSSGPQVKLSFNPSTGGSALFDYLKPSEDVTSKFYCQATNSRGSVRSNMINFYDYRHQFPAGGLKSRPEPAAALYKDGPFEFKCLDTTLSFPPEIAVALNYKWHTCGTARDVEFRDCGTQTDILKMAQEQAKPWPVQVLPNGNLFIPYFTADIVNRLTNEKLICLVDQIPFTFYNKQLKFRSESSPNKVTKLEITTPKGTEKLTLLNSKNTRITKSCNFKVGVGSYTASWTYNGKGKSITLAKGYHRELQVRVTETFQLRFEGPFTKDTPGNYICEVNWTPTGGAAQTATGTYQVSLEYFPTASDKMVPKKFVVDGTDGRVDCMFDNPFPTLTTAAMGVVPSVAISGTSLDLTSETALKNSVKGVNSMYASMMAPLTVKVAPLNPPANKVLKYVAQKMVYKSSLSSKSSSHQVQCVGSNKIGSVRKNVLLQVVPTPALDNVGKPSSLNCTQCSAALDHVIKCVVTNKKEIVKSKIIFSQYWMLGKSKVSVLIGIKDSPAKKYLIVSADKTELRVKKIDDEKFKKSVNEAGKIYCVITYAYPKDMKLPAGVVTKGPDKGVFYNSMSDTNLSKDLETPIYLTKIAPAPKAASASWIIAVAVACFILLLVIALIVTCCRRRGVGETYNVDEKEKEQGNDPEAENAEKEAFPIFERPEDGPIRGSRASLDDSIQVGSDDEDEVLAEYDVDIGKFDEEGSFIGQYATNEGGGGGGAPTNSRRLPQVANNTEV